MDIDVVSAADMMMKVYAENAVAEALKRADNLLRAGDLAAAKKFTEVAALIAQRQGVSGGWSEFTQSDTAPKIPPEDD